MKEIKKLKRTFEQSLKSDFYAKKFADVKTPKNITEFEAIPFTTKQELRSMNSPYELLAVDESDIVQVNTTSGTTGFPTFSLYTSNDLLTGSKEVAKAWKAFGVTKESRVQFIMSYGLFSGASHNTLALQSLGALVIPVGIQPLSRQLQYIEMFKPDTLVGTPSFFMHLYSTLKENNQLSLLENWSVKRVIAAGEIYSHEYRLRLEQNLGVKVHNHYGMCEIYSGFAYECDCRTGLHILDELVYVEVIDPSTGKVVPDGQTGELVVTSIHKEATPIIRYRTGDITVRHSSDKNCACAQSATTSYMIDSIHHRIDDTIFIKGLKVDPHLIRDFLLREFGAYIQSDVQIEVSKEVDFNEPTLRVTLRAGASEEFLKSITDALQQETLVRFRVAHVEPEHFKRNSENKMHIIVFK